MVEDTQSEDVGGLHKLAMYAKVGVAGAKIPAGVIVGENNRGSAVGDHVGEYLAGVNLTAVEQADRVHPQDARRLVRLKEVTGLPIIRKYVAYEGDEIQKLGEGVLGIPACVFFGPGS